MPASIFLLAYIIMGLLYFIANIFIIYHLRRYSVDDDASRIMSAIFIIGSVSLFFISLLIVIKVNWAAQL
jgi:hypothetical protein